MIVSFDGNTYLGKTSIIKALKARYIDSIICDEYDTYVNLLSEHTHLENQKYYFGLEAERQIDNKEGQLTLLDRSFLSILAHSYAVSHMEKKNLLGETVDLLKIQNEKSMIVCQQLAVFFVQPNYYDIYSDVNEKGGENILYNVQYRKYIDKFYKEILRILRVNEISTSCLSRIYVCKKDMLIDGLISWLGYFMISDTLRVYDGNKEFFSILLSAVEKILYKVSMMYDK